MSTALSWITVLLILIARVSLSQGWTELALTTSSGDIETEYLDFSLTKNRVQLQLTQLEDNSDLEFKIETLFFKQELQSSLVDTVRYSWNTHSSRTNSLKLDDVAAFEFCSETKSEMLTSIPTVVTIDLNTDYVVEIQDGSQGTFSSATVDPCPEVWTSFTNNRASITKVKVKLTDADAGYKLESKYMIKYRVIAACEAGQFLGNDGCENCATDHYGAGGWLTSCTQCPTGKGVEAGKGTQESDCAWKPCSGGQYLDAQTGCQTCGAGFYSAGGTVSECTKCDADKYSEAGATQCTGCPSGKGVASGEGKQESDCIWKPCTGGKYLDNEKGCVNCEAGFYSAGGTASECAKCDADKYSEAGASKCTECPSGKGVSSGDGKQESDCTWKACTGGQYLDAKTGCQTCGAGFYSAGGTVSECTKCDADKYSGTGATQCTDCPSGKGVASGDGKQESDCKEIVWKFTSVTLMRVQDDETLTGGNEGILVLSVDKEFHPTTVNFTFCDSGFSNETASLMCTHLGFGGGTFGSSPQNFQYISETLLISKEMPPLSADGCATSYNSTVSAECMAKLKENTGCDLDNTVWIKCAVVIDDRGSSSPKISATVLVTILNIVFFCHKNLLNSAL